jgi:hypothetical protein
MNQTIRRILIAGASAWALVAAGSPVQAADPFKLTSSTLEDNAPLAVKNAGNNKQNPNCVGENVSPPLAWSNPPAGTTSYALLMYDPEGRGGLGVVHWVAYGGPCTPPGDWHHYTFTLIATDLDPKALEPGLTKDQLFEGAERPRQGRRGPDRTL